MHRYPFLFNVCRRGTSFEQTVKLGGQSLFMNNALPPPPQSIVQAKRGTAPKRVHPLDDTEWMPMVAY